jgi:hypothetical protein
MYHIVTRMKSSMLARVSVLVAIATLGTTLVAATSASARPPRPGASPCRLGTVGGNLSVTDGSEIEITVAVPPSQGGGTAKLRYQCDNGQWVQISRLDGVVHQTIVSTSQLATGVLQSGSKTLAVTLRGTSVKRSSARLPRSSDMPRFRV